jgi:tetratricopeptide (TPR) repeat protein
MAASGAVAPPFVGRTRELSVLAAALDDARAGHTRFLALTGEPGIGKTRTVEEFVQRFALPEERVVWGWCPEPAGAPSYRPWVRALDACAASMDTEALRAAVDGDAPLLAHLLPTLRARLPEIAPTPPGGDDPQAHFGLLASVSAFLRRVARHDCLVVVLEDLHWADEASLQLLAFVARELRAVRLMLVATYREREQRRTPRAAADAIRVCEPITLRGLGHGEVEALVGHATVSPPQPSLVARLHQLTDGNPFFLDEVLRVLRDDGRLGDGSAFDEPVPLPQSVRDTVRLRLDPLAAEDRDLLSVAAVVGREFDVGVLHRAADLTPDTVLARLSGATAAGLVEEGAVPGRFRFAHALVRETLSADLLPLARARLHQRVAAVLETLHGTGGDPPLAEIAIHYARAAPLGAAAKAVEFSLRAGRQAMAMLAYEDAVAHYERALAALALEPPDDRRRMEVLLAVGDAAWRAGRNPRAREAFAQAVRCARALGDRQAQVRGTLRFAHASLVWFRHDPAVVELLDEALGLIPDGDDGPRAHVLAALASALYFSSDFARCDAASQEAVEAARRVGVPEVLVTALLARQLVLLGPGDTAERLALANETAALAAATGKHHAGHVSQLSRALCLLERGDIAAAAQEVERMRLDAEQSRLPERRWHATAHRASLAIFAGRLDEGRRLATEALAIRRDAGDPAAAHAFTVQLYLCRRERGDAGALEGAIRDMAKDFPNVPAWRCVLATFLVESGRAEEAGALLDALAPDDFAALRRDYLYPASLAWLAKTATALRDTERSRTLYRLLLPFADRNIVVFSSGCLGSAHRYLALLAATAGDVDGMFRHFEAALEMNHRMGARPALANTQHELARCLLAVDRPGDRERAQSLLAAARETAAACGLLRLSEQLDVTEPAAPDTVRAPELEAEPPGSASWRDPARPDDLPRPGGTDTAIFRRDVDYWTVAYGDASFQLKDTKGLVLLQTLLRHPGQEFHVLDLAGAGAPGEEGGGRAAAGDAGELLDPAARAAYRRRLEDLRDELEEARTCNDPARASRAEHEIAFLTDELAQAVGLGGRARKAASAAERARVNVTRTVGGAVKKIAAGNPALGQHLVATIRTGTFCSYTPDPRVPIVWTF